jgi:hypothetical protein
MPTVQYDRKHNHFKSAVESEWSGWAASLHDHEFSLWDGYNQLWGRSFHQRDDDHSGIRRAKHADHDCSGCESLRRHDESWHDDPHDAASGQHDSALNPGTFVRGKGSLNRLPS